MHQTIKTVFRLCFAAVIFLITAALILTCLSKTQEIVYADKYFHQAKNISLDSTANEQLVLLSNNQSPDKAIFILLANNGYIAKVHCEHYLKDICLDNFNKSHTRQIQHIDLIKVGQFHYIKQVSFTNSRSHQQHVLKYSDAQIKQFYQQDISGLKYIVFGVALFAIAAIYISIRILRNFKSFLNK
ncbi:MAG: hypothetical protein ACN6OV_09240 [Acinetobacter sp.]|uniref:hypothetical protein n=1 Tax=Acinetobacter sp. TaxID=472 RepID=UPI003CFC228B